MKVSYLCKGLTCPHCAGKIEAAASQMAGVLGARADLLSQTLHIESEDSCEPKSLLAEIRAIVARYEPQVEVLSLEDGQVFDFAIDSSSDRLNCEAISQAVRALPGVTDCKVSAQSISVTVQKTGPLRTKDALRAALADIVAKQDPNASVRSVRKSAKEKKGLLQSVTLAAGLLFIPALVLWYSGHLSGTAGQLVFYSLYLLFGFPVLTLALRSVRNGSFFDENMLMSIATVGALALGELPEACAVMLFYRIGEYFQERAVLRSRNSIAHLMDLRADSVTVLTDEGERVLSPNDVCTGDRFLVRPGERVAVDGVVESGDSSLDLRALTGESVPVAVTMGDRVLSGSVNGTGALTVRATCDYSESTVARILAMIESAQSRKSKAERFITRFARWYTPLVVGAALLIATLPPLLGFGAWPTWIHRSLIFLIVSCPCALVLSIPLTFFAGIGAASRQGILVKGGSVLESLGHLDTLVLDKTGTVTEGRFSLDRILPAQGVSSNELLACARLALSHSSHPIARALSERIPEESQEGNACEFQEFPGLGVRAEVSLERHETIHVGNPAFFEREGISCSYEAGCGVLVARDGRYLGQILVADTLRSQSAETLKALKRKGVRRIVLLSGDSKDAVAKVAQALPIDDWYAELLPQDKVGHVEALLHDLPTKGKLAFVGDGINDAPVLARSDIGIAMGGIGSDAALEAADLVLMTDEPKKILTALAIAEKTQGIATANIVMALGVKALVLLLGAVGLAGLWAAVFADVGVTVLAVANALRLQRDFPLDCGAREE
ncbi:MAG: cadmium-translocating P-type ATPase [Desulfovibrionaceae bacterium]|nr:cadmium-translocating P-type ATPase [Desulfovibrionaceae bacterium]